MKKLEIWLIKWRLSINPSKCQYILFGKGPNKEVNIQLMNESIPAANEIKFLGMISDK